MFIYCFDPSAISWAWDSAAKRLCPDAAAVKPPTHAAERRPSPLVRYQPTVPGLVLYQPTAPGMWCTSIPSSSALTGPGVTTACWYAWMHSPSGSRWFPSSVMTASVWLELSSTCALGGVLLAWFDPTTAQSSRTLPCLPSTRRSAFMSATAQHVIPSRKAWPRGSTKPC